MSNANRIEQGPPDAAWTVILAHGAGAGMDTPFMDAVAGGLADAGHRVIRFEFPYMVRRRAQGGRRPPDRMPKLLAAYREVIAQANSSRLAIGGKSMGGRVASMVAGEDDRPDAVICLGYPFHPPGKPDRLRVDHLRELETPTLVVQGTRDPFGTREEVGGYPLDERIRFHWLGDGDHSFKPRRASGHTLDQHLGAAVGAVDGFLRSL